MLLKWMSQHQHVVGLGTNNMSESNFFRKYADMITEAEGQVTEAKNKYKYIQKEVDVKDMDTMSPEELQRYADFIRKHLNSMKRWIRDEMGDTYANLKKDPDNSDHWSVVMCGEYIEELKQAAERGAIVKPSGGAKRSTSVASDSRGLVGPGSGFAR